MPNPADGARQLQNGMSLPLRGTTPCIPKIINAFAWMQGAGHRFVQPPYVRPAAQARICATRHAPTQSGLGGFAPTVAKIYRQKDTNRVRSVSSRIAIVAVFVLVAGVGWFGIKQHRCNQRNAAFSRRIEMVKQDAHEQLKVGTKKDDIARFYTEHKIPFEAVGSEVIGTLNTIGGCAPLGCGTDNALIGVRIRVDADGTAIGEPEFVGMYTDCL